MKRKKAQAKKKARLKRAIVSAKKKPAPPVKGAKREKAAAPAAS